MIKLRASNTVRASRKTFWKFRNRPTVLFTLLRDKRNSLKTQIAEKAINQNKFLEIGVPKQLAKSLKSSF